jgi:hypothetical protein
MIRSLRVLLVASVVLAGCIPGASSMTDGGTGGAVGAGGAGGAGGGAAGGGSGGAGGSGASGSGPCVLGTSQVGNCTVQ